MPELEVRKAVKGRHAKMAVSPFILLAVLLSGLSGSAAMAAQSPQITHISIVSGAYALTTTAFSPDVITVVIGVNNTVVWTNDDSVTHDPYSSSFTTEDISPGGTGSYAFTSPGTYPYYCYIHPTMVGKIIVLGSASTTTTSSSNQSSTGTQTSSSSSTSGGGGIPEFPTQLWLTLMVTMVIVMAYVFTRRSIRTGREAPP